MQFYKNSSKRCKNSRFLRSRSSSM